MAHYWLMKDKSLNYPWTLNFSGHRLVTMNYSYLFEISTEEQVIQSGVISALLSEDEIKGCIRKAEKR